MRIKQNEILKYLTGWSAPSYSRLEEGITAPNFDDLIAIHQAFVTAGIPFTWGDLRQYVTLAHKRIDLQQTYKYQKTEDEWAQLLLDLLRSDESREKDGKQIY